MKRFTLTLILFVWMLVSSLYAQSFTYTALETQKYGVLPFTQFYAEIHNLSTPNDSFLVIKEDTGLPLNWTASICVGYTCYPPPIDSAWGVIPIGGFDSVLVDFTPDSTTALDGYCTVSVQPLNHPELAVSITFHVYFGTAVRENPIIPVNHALLTAYPNPFNPDVTLALALDHATLVTLGIYDLRGQRVAEVFTGSLAAGQHDFQWHAGDIASGVYLAQINLSGKTTVQKVVLLR